MNAILLKAATIVDPSSKHHLKKRDLLIKNGKIQKIASSITDDHARKITLPNLHISQGWFDSSVCFGEPGYEERETIANGLKTAALSGFSHIALQPNTLPVPDSKSGIQYLVGKSRGNAVSLYPVGTLTKGGAGEELAELFDMTSEHAISFYDFKHPLENANLLKIALQYSQNFDGLVQSFPMEPSVARQGIVNEEVTSTQLGLKGIPALSEELQITRDLYLLEYTGGKLHIPTISTKKSVALIKQAKKDGLDVSCSVSINNLFFTDSELHAFDTHFKLLPPLRTSTDVKALIRGLEDGIIDGVTSDHIPMTVEDKQVEFDHAAFGSIGLESCFGALHAKVGLETAVRALQGLKERFGVTCHSITEGSQADLTLFNPDHRFEFTKEHIQSNTANAAMLGNELTGRAYGILAHKKLVIHD